MDKGQVIALFKKGEHMKKRVLLKLSGEALGNDHEVFDIDKLNELALEIKEIVSEGIELAIVCGGGNFVRGRTLEKLGIDRVKSDYMGMMGTVINAIALESVLNNHGLKAKALSALEISKVETYNQTRSRQYLDDGQVVIFGGGIAWPYFSTDTTCALRAIENHCHLILMAKNGTDGVYDDDPKVNPNARRYDEMDYDTIINKQLNVIDMTAAIMLREHNLSTFIFDMNVKGNIKKAINLACLGTIIKTKEN